MSLKRSLFVAVALPAVSISAALAASPCVTDVVGIWQQTHAIISSTKVPDESQQWTFKKGGGMKFTRTKPPLNIDGRWSCDGDQLNVSGRISTRYKITEHEGDNMTLVGDNNATVFVKRLGK